MTPMLAAKDLQVRYGGRTVVQVAELTIGHGDFLALIGPNGAGKTTLLQTLASLLKPAQGQILFKGEPIGSGKAELAFRRRQAMVFQEPLLFSTTVFENVAAGLKLRGTPRERVGHLVTQNLARFGIAHLAQRSARKISGGEAQRTSLARALATEPEVLFLDEPFSALDPPTREALIEDLEKVLKSSGITAVMTTHDHSEALRLSNRMAVMIEGRIRQLDDPATVFHKPADRQVAEFVGVDNRIAGNVVGSDNSRLLIEAFGSRLQAGGAMAVGAPVTLCLRPESVRLAGRGQPPGDGPANTLAGRIVKVIPMGHFCRVHLDCGFALTALWTEDAGPGWSIGDPVTVWIPPEAIHLISGH